MNAEALIGMVLGTCTLQKLIGQGGMGAVYLAQQSRPRRQVAVKVLLPITPLAPNQQAAFLERFRRETDAAASLVHPNIMPVHEYGERDGLAYLVMPYISGGTLRDELERAGPLSLAQVVNYLDQMAAALDFAHERGVIHRDVKPANILMTPEGRLVLSDFGLVKIIADGQSSPQPRLTGIGVPMGTPDYMAPEQALGGEVDTQADLYSLGCILYHMVTGNTPFHGDLPMQVAMQHLHTPPALPRSFRPDLPAAAEEVILRSLAKHTADRYARVQDFASAFRTALTAAGARLSDNQAGLLAADNGPESRLFTRRGLFDPMWQHNGSQGSDMTNHASSAAKAGGAVKDAPRNDIVAQTSMTLPSFSGILPPATGPAPADSASPSPVRGGNTPLPPAGMRLGRKTSLLHTMDAFSQIFPPTPRRSPAKVVPPEALSSAEEPTAPSSPADPAPLEGAPPAGTPPVPASTGMTNNSPGHARARTGTLMDAFGPPATPTGSNNANATSPRQGKTGALMVPVNDSSGQTTSLMKLTQPVKVVKVPVAGQPGRYVTGLLPVLTNVPEPAAPPNTQEDGKDNSLQGTLKRHVKVIALALVVLLVLSSTGIFWLASKSSRQSQNLVMTPPPNLTATVAWQGTASAEKNIRLADQLSENTHNWPVASKGSQMFVFKDGAYHITNNDNNKHSAFALLPDEVWSPPFVYSLTASQIKGDDKSIDNQFGLVFHYNAPKKNGKTFSTFYFFGVASAKPGGEYQFWKYDDSLGSSVAAWTKLWHQPLGREYNFGQGSTKKNTFKVAVKGKSFTFFMNGKRVGATNDSFLTSGQIGMLVNLKGTEVSFSNLMLTHE